MKQHPLSCAIAFAALICCTHSKTFSQTDWHITGNSGTNATNNFVGTTDNVPLSLRTNNKVRMRINGNGDIGIGTNSPVQQLDVNGNINIRSGFGLYIDNHRVLRTDSLNKNTFLGVQAEASIAGGTNNTANGYAALYNNIGGVYNSAVGSYALNSNTSGNYNAAVGSNALYNNKTGFDNTVIGISALYGNTYSYSLIVDGKLIGSKQMELTK